MAKGDEIGGQVGKHGAVVDGDSRNIGEPALTEIDDAHPLGDGAGGVGAESVHLAGVDIGAAGEDDAARAVPAEQAQVGALSLRTDRLRRGAGL